QSLTAAFSAGSRTLVVDSAHGVPGVEGDLETPEVTRALNELERQHETILFIADPEVTPWSEKVLRHADLVLAVGIFGADAGLNPLERRAAEYLSPDAIRLVLLHPTRTRIKGTARWLD